MKEYKAEETKANINFMAYLVNLGSHKATGGKQVNRGKCPICNIFLIKCLVCTFIQGHISYTTVLILIFKE